MLGFALQSTIYPPRSMLAMPTEYHCDNLAIVSKRPLARSNTLKSFESLLSAHNERQEVLSGHGRGAELGHILFLV